MRCRFLFRVFLGIIVFLILIACVKEAKDTKKSNKSVLKVSSMFSGGDEEYFKRMVKQYDEDHPGVKIDLSMKDDFENYYPDIIGRIANKEGPDVAVIHMGRLNEFLRRNLLTPIPTGKDGIDPELFPQNLLGRCQKDSKLYLVPLDVFSLVVYYNTEILKQAGITEYPKKASDFISFNKKIRNNTDAVPLAIDTVPKKYQAYTLARFFLSALYQQDAQIFLNRNNKFRFNSKEGKTAYKYLKDIVHDKQFTKPGMGYEESVNVFRSGKAAAHINGTWVYGLFNETEGLTFVQKPFPPLFGKKAAWSGSHGFAIPNHTKMNDKTKKEAVRFINWMTSHSELWAKSGQIPACLPVFEKEQYRTMKNTKIQHAILQQAVTNPKVAGWQKVFDNIADILAGGIAQNLSAEDVLPQLEEATNMVLPLR